MRAPPPVGHASRPGPAWRAALASVLAAAAAVPVAWLLPYAAAALGEASAVGALLAGDAPQRAIVCSLALAAFGLAWRALAARFASERLLRWDVAEWALDDAGDGRATCRGHADLMLDLGPWLLVRFRLHDRTAGPRWLPLQAGGDAARWSALRGALWNGRADAPERA